MQVVQVVFGKFHHFHLARQLARHDELAAIFSGYPWSKLRGEGIDRDKVRTFPWIAAPLMASAKLPSVLQSSRLRRAAEWYSQETIDRFAARNLPECDILVGLSASGLRAGRVAQQRGAKFVCDRGSTHIACQDRLLDEEHLRWKVPWEGIDRRVVEKQIAEYEAADLITVPSEFTYQSFLHRGIDTSKLAKVPYGANVSRFSPQGRPDPARFVILFVGQVTLRKGVPYLLQAFARLQHPRKELWIVGEVEPRFSKVLNRLPTKDVQFLGTINNSNLAALYSKANAFVLASIEEGLAMVQGEALACGCPVIATENSGAADLFSDGVEGFIVPARDPAAITERLSRLADDPRLREQMSRAALARVERIGGWDQYGENYRAALRTLLISKGASPQMVADPSVRYK